jgi:heme/copper-type cytochrome/quinol oxidase subunit 2
MTATILFIIFLVAGGIVMFVLGFRSAAQKPKK